MIDRIVFEAKLRVVKSMLIPGRSLDVGCGNKKYTREIPRCIGVDPNPEFEGTVNSPDMAMSAENLRFRNGSFSNVLLLDTLEHVKDPEKAVSEVSRVLIESGSLIIVDPNDDALFWCRLLALRFRDAFRGNPDHLHRFTEKTLKELLKGFVLDKKTYRVIFTGYRFRKVSF